MLAAAGKARSRWPSCSPGEDDLLIGARRGAPLAVGHGEGDMMSGSDAIAPRPSRSRSPIPKTASWRSGDAPFGLQILRRRGKSVERPIVHAVAASLATVYKGNHRHFMLKEIYEQPEAISHTLAHDIDPSRPDLTKLPEKCAGRFLEARPDDDVGLRNGKLRRACRQILVREAGAVPVALRSRLRIPLRAIRC